jgi:membrane-associated phospholipid phosphatase
MMDAFIACWHAKFKWWTERPVTVIREKLDADFMPHVITPAFPSYVSGHSAASGAGAEVLAAYFPSHAKELRRMALEASMSRLYGGIHYRSDNEEGLALGRRVGARAVERAQSPAVTR